MSELTNEELLELAESRLTGRSPKKAEVIQAYAQQSIAASLLVLARNSEKDNNMSELEDLTKRAFIRRPKS